MRRAVFLMMAGAWCVAGCGQDGKGNGGPADPPPGQEEDGDPEGPVDDPDEDPDDDPDTTDEPDPTDDGTDSETGGCSFIGCEDVGDDVGRQCDIWTPGDCGDGEKCMPWANDGGNAWNATKCSPLDANPAQAGDDCTTVGSGVSGEDTCEAGSMCWNPDPDTGVGTCVPFCGGNPMAGTCERQTDVCSIFNEGVLPLCLPSCDPLLQDCPTDRDVCVGSATSDAFLCVLDASGEGGAYQDPCEFVNACDPGLYCAAPEAVPGCTARGCCSEFCDHTDPAASEACSGADGGQECVPAFADGTAPPRWETVGVCAIPS